MRLFDTRSRDTHEVIAGHTIRLYVCGITPYDATHLGHAFTYVAFDVLQRALERRGHRVRYVRNVTDVDDDILRTAAERGVDYQRLAQAETARFDQDMRALGVRPPDVEPRATQTIGPIITAIQGLLLRGSAYTLPDGRVYFDIATAGDRFGALSRLDREQMLGIFAEKGGDPQAAGKRDPLDFLLWQPSRHSEPSWPSPWGDGRPGWHIECSVMAMEHLGAVVDIHGGGNDLIYPHHEAEILQSEHLTQQGPFARLWVHTGMVATDGVKMSKSLGNLIFVRDLLDRVEGAVIRCCLLAHHYRGGWSCTDEEFAAAGERLKRWQTVAALSGRDRDAEQACWDALDDDLATPRVLDLMDSMAAAGHGTSLRRVGAVLGFQLHTP